MGEKFHPLMNLIWLFGTESIKPKHMKKIIAIVGFSLMPCVASWAQGTINFQNIGTGAGSTSVDAPIFNVDMVTKLSGTGFSVQLYAGPNAGALSPVGTAATFLSGSFAGYFTGGTVQIPGFAQGSTPVLQVRAWDNQGGTITSYDSAIIRGASSTFTSPALGDDTPPIDPATIPVPQGLTSFSLVVVPEPSIIALGILGAAGIILRRRKA
jgi:hypothetical protein